MAPAGKPSQASDSADPPGLRVGLTQWVAGSSLLSSDIHLPVPAHCFPSTLFSDRRVEPF